MDEESKVSPKIRKKRKHTQEEDEKEHERGLISKKILKKHTQEEDEEEQVRGLKSKQEEDEEEQERKLKSPKLGM